MAASLTAASSQTTAESQAQPPAKQYAQYRDGHPRLSMNTPGRITVGSAVAAAVGLSLGATQGGQMAQLRFRAEHAHKMPDSTTGWYLYHKTKNYHAMYGGIREGLRMAVRTGFWSFMALSLESTVDRCRGASDMFSTIVASLTVAGAFSLWRKSHLSMTCGIPYPTSQPRATTTLSLPTPLLPLRNDTLPTCFQSNAGICWGICIGSMCCAPRA